MKLRDRIKYIVPSRILGLQPYKVEASENFVKLDAMENPHELSDALQKKWAKLLMEVVVNRYPDSTCSLLKNRLRPLMELDDSIDMLFGNGSDEIINLLCLVASGGAGGAVLFPEPTFSVYRLSAEVYGLKVIGVPMREDNFSCDLESMLRVIQAEQPSLIFLASPNNPTGNSVDEDLLVRCCGAADGLVVLDEAYCKFAKVSRMKLLSSIENLVIMQTFSKIGFAGIRLGVLFGSVAWIDVLNRVRMPYNINSLTQAAGAFALDHFDEFQDSIDDIIAEREKMMQFMSKLDSIKVWSSDANFILFRSLVMPSSVVYDGLKNHGILIKNMSGGHPALLNCLRVTIGKEGENILFREKLMRVIEQESS